MPTFTEHSLLRCAKPGATGCTWRLALSPLVGAVLLGPFLLGLFLLSGCAAFKPGEPATSSRATMPSSSAASTTHTAHTTQNTQTAQASATPAPAVAPTPAAAPASTAVTPSQPDPALTLVSYAERLRSLQAPELPAELSRLSNNAAPQSQLQYALALAQMQQLPELIRAQDTVAKVLSNSSDEAKALHPIARLLALRLGEERRLEDLLDKQNQQVKDLQRRLDQTTERLEALKAIERSLVSRPMPVLPSVSTPTAGSRARTPTGTGTSTPASPRSGLPQAGPQP